MLSIAERYPCVVDLPEISVTAALALWSGWGLDIPPNGLTGDAGADKRLADAFRALVALPLRDDRLLWIEQKLFSTSDFPPPAAPADPYRGTLIRWWMELYITE